MKKPSWMTLITSWVTKKAILTGYDEIIQVLTDNKSLDAESAQLQNESEVILELIRKFVDENFHVALDQAD